MHNHIEEQIKAFNINALIICLFVVQKQIFNNAA